MPAPALADPTTSTDAQPRIGLALGTALYVASVLGTGILLLPTLAARAAGPASLVAVGLVLLASVPLAAAFAALATRHPDSGGVATYVRLALGPTAARMTGYWFFFGVCVGAPVVALLGAQYVVAMLGGAQWHVYLVGAAFLVPPLVTNAVGLRLAGPVQLALTGALVVLVVGVVLVSLPAADPANLTPFAHGWAGVGAAASLYVWAFAGWEAVTHLAGEFRDPRRTIPRATAIALVVVGIAYLALQYVTVTVLTASSDVPLMDLVDVGLPDVGRVAVAVVAGIVTLGVLGTYVGAFAKLGASLGRDGDLPRWVARGAQPGGVPRRALLVVAALVTVYFALAVATGGELEPFVLVHTSCMVAIYAVGMAAALRLLDRGSAGWWAAAVACVLALGLAALAGWHLVVPLGLALVAVAVGVVRRARVPAAR
ncbi:amino acid permease-associated protein [Cellulomonas sp. Root485]|uniref:APC family permease n=1 Tax=Cellulomonas sp. Root485 TaxID=1736546 RepID=UPI0006F7A690|nr:amino acid permease [Cellulomonas sp. Root485]KQY21391.1 amino acid permease-associated protein [Cellulomonas sp. Root485]